MQYSILFSIVSVASLASAQVSTAGLPKCASSCLDLGSLTSLGCSSSLDFKCICTNQTFIDGLSCCVKKNCGADDIAKTIKFANGICAQASVTLPQTPSCPSTSASSGSSAKSSASSSKTSAASASASSSGAAASAASTSASAAAGSASSSVSAAGSSATPTGGAASFMVQGAGTAGGLIAALAALL